MLWVLNIVSLALSFISLTASSIAIAMHYGWVTF